MRGITELTDLDKSLLNILQDNLPVCERPFAVLAEKLHTDEETVLERLRHLKKVGYLRRIGTFFDSNKLGYRGTLIALQVAPAELPKVAKAVNRYSGVTHNYEREGKYNLWFTLMSPDAESENKAIKEIAALPGVETMLNLKAKKKYKINVQFELK